MPVAYVGTVSDAHASARSGGLAGHIYDGFRSAFGRPPGDEEVETWRTSLPLVLDVTASAVPKECGVLVEYSLPFNDQRIDLLLIGAQDGKPAAHVLELKSWEESRASARFEHFVEVGAGTTPHPSYQALNYAGKLANFHSFGPRMHVSQSAVIADGGPENHESILGDRYFRFTYPAPLFVAPELDGLGELLRAKLREAPSPEWIREVVTGQYTQSAQLLDTLRERQQALLDRASEVLASCGWGLSRDQLSVRDEIMHAVRQEERAVFCVSGGPGSGKSLLAMHLFMGAIGLRRRTILAVRNNRLNAALREILNEQVIGAQGMVKYFSTGTAGVEDDAVQVADVLICDEGQRLALRSPNVFLRAPLVIVLYDEEQILNEAERGTTRNILEMCDEVGVAPRLRTLPTPHRCRGGHAYLRWVNLLLEDPQRAARTSREWSTAYEFSIASSPQDLITSLRGRTGQVGLLASFTRSSGKDGSRNPRDLGRVRVSETVPPVRWLMDPKRDYVPFYLHRQSNELTTCASIYGAQGFELDYAGLFWGSDLVIRSGGWVVGDPSDCYDRTQGARALSTVMREDSGLALVLLRNRYRILLTRGIFGTTVYCEDFETREFLRSLV